MEPYLHIVKGCYNCPMAFLKEQTLQGVHSSWWCSHPKSSAVALPIDEHGYLSKTEVAEKCPLKEKPISIVYNP